MQSVVNEIAHDCQVHDYNDTASTSRTPHDELERLMYKRTKSNSGNIKAIKEQVSEVAKL